VVLAAKPVITDDSGSLEPALLKALMEQVSSLASVYHKPADTFVSRQRLAVQTVDSVAGRSFEEEGTSGGGAARGQQQQQQQQLGNGADAAGAAAAAAGGGEASSAPVVDLLGDDLLGGPPAAAAAPAPPPAAGLDDLLGGLSVGGAAAAPAAAAAAPAAAMAATAAAAAAGAAADPFDLLGGGPAAAAASASAAAPGDLPLLLAADKGRGLVVRGRLARARGQVVYQLHLSNGSAGPVDGCMLQVNSNSGAMAPADQVVAVGTLPPGGSGAAQVVMAHTAAKAAPGPWSPKLQVRCVRVWGGGGGGAAGLSRAMPLRKAARPALERRRLLPLNTHPDSHATHHRLR
jgi:AP-1 complex subunit beta-1